MNNTDNNRLIIDFMEVPSCRGAGGGRRYLLHGRNARIDQLEYQLCWDWIMPVAKKIKSDLFGLHRIDSEKYAPMCEFFTQAIKAALWQINIVLLYETVVMAITWYNKQKEVAGE